LNVQPPQAEQRRILDERRRDEAEKEEKRKLKGTQWIVEENNANGSCAATAAACRVVSYRGEELKSAQTRAHANTREMRFTRRKKAVGDLARLKKRQGE